MWPVALSATREDGLTPERSHDFAVADVMHVVGVTQHVADEDEHRVQQHVLLLLLRGVRSLHDTHHHHVITSCDEQRRKQQNEHDCTCTCTLTCSIHVLRSLTGVYLLGSSCLTTNCSKTRTSFTSSGNCRNVTRTRVASLRSSICKKPCVCITYKYEGAAILYLL